MRLTVSGLIAAVGFLCVVSPVAVQSATAPDFSLPDTQGQTIRLSDLRGQIVIVYFWATWCPPCRREIPGLVALQKKYGPKGLAIIGVSMDDDTGILASFVRLNGINYPVVRGTPSVAASFGGVMVLPTTFIIDREGKILADITGFTTDAWLEAKIQPLF